VRIAYFVHDLTDPAVRNRIAMLRAGGAEILLLGFRRDDKLIEIGNGVKVIDLGRTFDKDFAQRILMVLKRCIHLGAWADELRNVDVLLARNLEMLSIAVAARRKCAPQARLVYESLDIHRLLLSKRIWGTCLRAVERALLRQANLLVTSAPAFLSEYFEARQGLGRGLRVPALVVENKMLHARVATASGASGPGREQPPGPPWRIGWFGMIRCRKSLDILCDLAARHPDLVQVTIRGRPSLVEFADFHGQVDRIPGVHFGGAYQPSDLSTLYQNVHFNWAIDYFEEGGNSAWLLPNRIYEGGVYNAVPLALTATETGRWLKRLGLGVLINSTGRELEEFFRHLTPARYNELKQASYSAPRNAFIADDRDVVRLLDALAAPSSNKENGSIDRRAPSSNPTNSFSRV
jgi:succinoglycan biosynthesis protein ExoL